MQPVASDDLDNVCQPVTRASGLPNRFYVDPDCFAAEKDHVFFASWSAVGFAKDVPAAGDVMPVDFLGVPMLLVRDRDGRVRVFQNTCRHRGMVLVNEKTRLRGVIRCPYHSWCYDLDGRLRTTPHVGGHGTNVHPDLDRSELGLWEFRSHVWLGVVFVNVSGTAAAFEDHAAPAIARWSEFDRDLFHAGPDSAFELEVAANWKLAVENFCESYHLPWVHPALNSYSKLTDHYHIESPGSHSGQGTHVYRPQLDASGTRFDDFAGLDAKWETSAEYIALYPNVLFGVHRDQVFAIILDPKALDRTLERVAIFYPSAEMCSPDWAGLRAVNTAAWKTVFEEDVFVVEGMQRGRHGPLFDGGRFAPAMDGPTHLFHTWIADRFRHD
jgi:choline monooxygenase